jgi:predicted ester cyclase
MQQTGVERDEEEEMETLARNAAAIREFTRTFKNEHNVDGIDHLFARSFRHNFPPPLRPGLEGLKDIGRMMNRAFPDVVVTEQDLIVTSDRVVERSSAAATHKGEIFGIPPTGRSVAWTEIHIYRMTEGKIAEHWAEISMHQLLQQLSAS